MSTSDPADRSSAASGGGASQTVRPARLRRWGQQVLNGAMRALLRSPIHGLLSRRILEITVIGRKTGTRYRFPVGYVRDEDALLVGTASTWYRNLVGGRPIEIRLEGRTRQATAEILTDEARCADAYRKILARNPVHGRFAGITLDADGEPHRDELRRALRRGITVLRLTVVA